MANNRRNRLGEFLSALPVVLRRCCALLLALHGSSLFAAGGNFGGGDGSAAQPYLVEDFADLQAISALYAAPQETAKPRFLHFQLTADIDAKKSPLLAIGSNCPTGFRGIFDGNQKTLSNVLVQQPSENQVGLFALITAGGVKNLTLQGSVIRGFSVVGGIVGRLASETEEPVFLENCRVVDTRVEARAPAGERKYTVVGGLCGESVARFAEVTIRACAVRKSLVSATADSVSMIGGLVGWNVASAQRIPPIAATIEACSAEAQFQFSTHRISNLGGLVGGNEASGFWEGSQATARVYRSWAKSEVRGLRQIGGLVGANEAYLNESRAVIEQCYADCAVAGIGEKEDVPFHIGGLVGLSGSYGEKTAATVLNCYAVGSVECEKPGNENIGGLIGLLFDRQGSGKAAAECSFAQVAMKIGGQGAPFSAGYFVGGNDGGKYRSCYATGKDYPGEEEKYEKSNRPRPVDAGELSAQSTFKDWDFNNVWKLNSRRPVLVNNEK